jgi:hypothetical protein
MHAFSAADSVSIAIRRTREFLFSPFNWGTYLKLGLVAIITEGSAYNFGSSNRGDHPSRQGPVINPSFDVTGVRVAAIAASVLLVIFVALVVLYLMTRLRFAYFHCLIHKTKEIRPGWEIYREPARRFFQLNVVVGLCFLLLVGVVALPFAAGFWRLFHQIPPGGHPDVVLLLSLLLPLLPVMLLLFLVGITADMVLHDCMMPHFALENATAGEAWSEVWASIRFEKTQFFVYGLLRLLLPLIAMVALFMVLIIPGLALAGAFGAIEYGVHSAFAGSTGTAGIAGVILQVFFGVVAFVFLLLATICLGGPLSTAIREYALTFYGGRYRVLGDILYPAASQLPPIPGASVVS